MKLTHAACGALCLLLLNACATRPSSVQATPIAQSEYDEHSCQDLKEAYAYMHSHDQRLSDEMSSAANTQVGLNVLGGVLMAATGFGYARTVNNSGHAVALAEVRGHLQAISERARKTSCDLPAMPLASR